MTMLRYTKTQIEIMAAKAAEVEIYSFNQADKYIHGIHTDNMRNLDIDTDALPAEFDGMVELMTEQEYNDTVLANSSVSADFADWYGNKDAKVLVVVLTMDSAAEL